jgi:hypothetical protein
MNLLSGVFFLIGMSFFPIHSAEAFCGFYVAKADTKLFNRASKVVMVRNEDKTVLTMVNDYEGDPKEFAVVVPVPTFLEKDQIHVGERAVVDHLDSYSAPRLVEYFDADPCKPQLVYEMRAASMEKGGAPSARGASSKALGVTVEASYTVGEYDIQILSAKESSGLETWLKKEGYKIPAGASRVLESYIKQKLRFFVAKVNLGEQAKLGLTNLRPLQVAYESPKFMLPIRLGTVNSKGSQELFIFALTKKARVETTNYRTVKLETGSNIPLYVKEDFGSVYRALFENQTKKEQERVLFLEYAWNMNWCDPCAAEPLSKEELRKLGVFWLDSPANGAEAVQGTILPMPRRPMPVNGAQEVFLTRLHVRYRAENFPEDLVFQETGDSQNFQVRYVLNHPFNGAEGKCELAKSYYRMLKDRTEEEAKNLASLTGWEIDGIREKMKNYDSKKSEPKDPNDPEPKLQPVNQGKPVKKWYQKLWGA